MTIYAMLSALEEDLRGAIKAALGHLEYQSPIFDAQLLARAKARLEKDVGFSYDESHLHDLVDYFDLGDTYQTINANPTHFRDGFAHEVKTRTRELEKLVPIRNRVMHIRPLDFEDLPTVATFVQEIAEGSSPEWTGLRETLLKLARDPSFVLGLSIPAPETTDRVSHNLPLPDFDETGLIGRDSVVKQVKKLCLGSFPVISIVGEGGLGKTALALKVAYELLEDDCPFDAIIWVTSKTLQITANEIRDIRGAITTSIGVVNEISSQLGGSGGENALAEVVEYLSTFKIALFIDNLETIMDDTIRQLVGALPEGSKIIITSRIGLGAYEYPIKLSGIEEKYASQLLRMLSKLRGVSLLASQDEGALRKYANRMHLSPGYIKWFVSAVQTGLSPEAVLQNSTLFLDFCMSNVYEYLSADARVLTATMQCAPGWKDIAELAYLSEFEALRIQRALQELMATNMLVESSKANGGSIKTTYQLAELSRAYLSKQHRPSSEFQKKINKNRNRLTALIESSGTTGNLNRYAFSNIKVRANSDKLMLKTLRDAFQHIQSNETDIAYELLDEARRLSPDYFEIHRMLAYFHQKSGNLSEARESYELAISLSPDTPQLHYWFGKFILQAEESADDAVEQFEIARSLDRASMDVALGLARGYMFQHRFSEVHPLLEELSHKLESMNDKVRKTYFDTRIQVRYREADDYCQASAYTMSVAALKEMKAEFEALPSFEKDTYLRGKLSKAAVIVQRLSRSCTGPDVQFVRDLSQWIERESRVPMRLVRDGVGAEPDHPYVRD